MWESLRYCIHLEFRKSFGMFKHLPTAVEVIGGGELLWPDIRCVSTNLACWSLTTLSKTIK